VDKTIYKAMQLANVGMQKGHEASVFYCPRVFAKSYHSGHLGLSISSGKAGPSLALPVENFTDY